ncbi:MAG: molybdenum cofactor biosynthesis protein MoaE [Chitinophagaceae bacterium]
MTASSLSHPPVVDRTPHITADLLDINKMFAGAHHRQAGGIVLFSGEVRENSNGRTVHYLEYEAHAPMASGMIAEIIEAAKLKWDLKIAIASHRVGKVEICESAVVVITASVHRHEAYAANRYIIDRIKHEVPIWKCEFFTDGTKEWGGNCNCHKITGDPSKHIYET